MGLAIAWFASRGHTVCTPLTDSQPYDLVVDMGEGLQTVQVKTTTCKDKRRNQFAVNLRTMGGNRSGTGKVKKLDKDSLDYLFIFTEAADQFLIPTTELRGTSGITLGPKYEQYRV